MNNLLVIGSTNTDLVIQTARFPAPGEIVLGSQKLFGLHMSDAPKLVNLSNHSVA